MKIIADEFPDFFKDFQLKVRKNLLLEEVYVYDIFEKIVDYFKIELILLKKSYLKLNYDQLIRLFPENWKGLKYFDKNKILYVYDVNDESDIEKIDFIKLDNEELIEIKNEVKNSEAFFASDLNCDKNIGLLVIKFSESFSYFTKDAVHELIHFFQWETGKSIYDFLNNKNFDISDEDLLELSKYFNVNVEKIKNIYEKIGTSEELEAYVNNVYYALKKYFKNHDIKFVKMFLGIICDCFENKNNLKFNSYVKNVQEKLNNFYLNFNSLKNELNFNFTFLLLFCFRNKGFNSFKNHIFSYYEKEFQNGTLDSEYDESFKHSIRKKLK